MQNKQQKRQAEKLQKASSSKEETKNRTSYLQKKRRTVTHPSFYGQEVLFQKEVPTTAQQTIPYQEIYPDGICRVDKHFFTKTLEFFDIKLSTGTK